MGWMVSVSITVFSVGGADTKRRHQRYLHLFDNLRLFCYNNICIRKERDIMNKISRTLNKMIEENKREILSNQTTLSDIEKK